MNIAIETLDELIQFVDNEQSNHCFKIAAEERCGRRDYYTGINDALNKVKAELEKRKYWIEAWVEDGSRPSPAWVVEAWTEEGVRVPRAWCCSSGFWHYSDSGKFIHPKVVKWRRLS